MESEDTAILAAVMWQEPTNDALSVYTDGSKLENGNCSSQPSPAIAPSRECGRAVPRTSATTWRPTTLSLSVLQQALCWHTGAYLRVYLPAQSVSSQAALGRLRNDKPGPGQWLLPKIARAENTLLAAGWKTEFRWVPGHHEVLGNELADRLAKEAAEGRSNRGSADLEVLNAASLSRIARATTEAKSHDKRLG